MFCRPLSTGEGTAYGARRSRRRGVDAPPTAEFKPESDLSQEGGQTSAPYFYWVIDGITSEN